ncbi:hypothetical protein GCM10009863_23530 [Streptomyces axinellae]|uniref:Uncharacterized protein n=1 Tax=Streptomyces axinellae TaxID=552788 RepID=A0ABN3Q004_9ACTN
MQSGAPEKHAAVRALHMGTVRPLREQHVIPQLWPHASYPLVMRRLAWDAGAVPSPCLSWVRGTGFLACPPPPSPPDWPRGRSPMRRPRGIRRNE